MKQSEKLFLNVDGAKVSMGTKNLLSFVYIVAFIVFDVCDVRASCIMCASLMCLFFTT